MLCAMRGTNDTHAGGHATKLYRCWQVVLVQQQSVQSTSIWPMYIPVPHVNPALPGCLKRTAIATSLPTGSSRLNFRSSSVYSTTSRRQGFVVRLMNTNVVVRSLRTAIWFGRKPSSVATITIRSSLGRARSFAGVLAPYAQAAKSEQQPNTNHRIISLDTRPSPGRDGYPASRAISTSKLLYASYGHPAFPALPLLGTCWGERDSRPNAPRNSITGRRTRRRRIQSYSLAGAHNRYSRE